MIWEKEHYFLECWGFGSSVRKCRHKHVLLCARFMSVSQTHTRMYSYKKKESDGEGEQQWSLHLLVLLLVLLYRLWTMWVLMVDFSRDLMKVTLRNFDVHDNKCATHLQKFSSFNYAITKTNFAFFSLWHTSALSLFRANANIFQMIVMLLLSYWQREAIFFLSAPQMEQESKTILSTKGRLLNIYIILLFKREFYGEEHWF